MVILNITIAEAISYFFRGTIIDRIVILFMGTIILFRWLTIMILISSL